MEKDEIYEMVLERVKACFTPTEKELVIIENRLKQYDAMELKNLEENFSHFGVDSIVECLYGLKFP